uniref:Uncharacterized protein n=1 Tax=Glossina pallidipes TaxID=7398 RepID=A0A1B0A1A0_GLOPL
MRSRRDGELWQNLCDDKIFQLPMRFNSGVRLLRLNDLRDFFFFSSLRAESKMASISLSKVWSLILEEFKPVLSSITFSSANAEDSTSCSPLLDKLPIVCSSRKSGEDKYRVLAINGSNNKPRKANSCPLGITTVLGEYSSSKRGKTQRENKTNCLRWKSKN